MSESNYDLLEDLHEAQMMVNSMNAYVLQSNLYYTLGNDLPMLTLGGFLLRRRRILLFQDQLPPEHVVRFYDIEEAHGHILQEWKTHYLKKIIVEAQSRLDVISYFLEECAEGNSSCIENYRNEALRRTIVQELLLRAETLNVKRLDSLKRHVRSVDSHLQPILEKAEFTWDERLKPAYSQAKFWWLYATPKLTDADRPTGEA